MWGYEKFMKGCLGQVDGEEQNGDQTEKVVKDMVTCEPWLPNALI